ncbi:AMP-binding protein [Paracraurococcus lichenis]|uniref:AMP-binding protein n=1 Tax=Paracraurococcus lichenis TaxID=3064888 RepID=A0ABT9EA07_9PROT|nr:AMP-binding protein [Paracraurococcus sp. LOR1-02]MDO9712755.1 AMP-binding protein [Paracraurococcus sp. LOR1-02]
MEPQLGTAEPPAFFVPTMQAEPLPSGACIARSSEPLGEYIPHILSHLFRWADQAPDRPFLQERAGGTWRGVTYAETASCVRRIGGALLAKGLGPERPVVVLSGNSVDHGLLALAAQLVGVPLAPVSPAYSLASADLGTLRHVLRLLQPGLIYVGTAQPFVRALALDEAAVEIIASDPTGLARARPFSDLMKQGPEAACNVVVDPDAAAKILFTSGSTGTPKGVITTHRMMAANQQQLLQIWPFLEREPPVLLDWLPWHHVFGGCANFNVALRYGGTLWIDDGRPMPGADLERTLRNMREVSPTMSFNVPRGWALLLPYLEADAALRHVFFKRLRLMFNGGAALPETHRRRLEALADAYAPRDVPVVSGWGLTETAPGITIGPTRGTPPGAIGTLLAGIVLKLQPADDKFEARVKGPNVTPGYWRDGGNNAPTSFDDEGYLLTGDAVRWIDAAEPSAGFVFDGRLAEDFKLSTGSRVYAGEIRLRALEVLAPLARDVVVTGQDRDEIGLLVFLRDDRRNEDLTGELRVGLEKLNAAAKGATSRKIGRALLLSEPPSLDAGEMTDKGSLNVRAILMRRATSVERLYDDTCAEVVRT